MFKNFVFPHHWQETKKQPIVGLVRYSEDVWFGCSPVKRDPFVADYFEYRFKVFKEFTLKSFQEQTDRDFNLLLLHGVGLPEEYKDRFAALEQENSFLYNVYSYRGLEAEFIEFSRGVSISFRIDNDDAVPKNFISRLKPYLKPEFVGHVISIPKILVVKRLGDNVFLKTTRYEPSNSMGLAYVTNKKYKHIHELGDHTKLNQLLPVILLAGYGGLQTINGENIVNESWGKSTCVAPEELKKLMEDTGYSSFALNCLNIVPQRHK
jgi:hypothetical protein